MNFLSIYVFQSLGAGCDIQKPTAHFQHLIQPSKPTVRVSDLPKSFDWSDVNNTNMVTPAKTQFLPHPCGSCWAFGATGALSDRIKIATKGHVPDMVASVQVLLNAGRTADIGSCNGGSDLSAYHYIYDHGITDETCLPYDGTDNNAWGESPPEARMCKTCDRFGACGFQNATTVLNVSSFGTVSNGLSGMQQEIFENGPISCSLYAHSASFEEYVGGVIKDDNKYDGTTHVITLIGWGEDESNTPYWIGRNSFGSSWGERYGFFRIERGKNTLNLELHPCRWAKPDPSTIAAILKQNQI